MWQAFRCCVQGGAVVLEILDVLIRHGGKKFVCAERKKRMGDLCSHDVPFKKKRYLIYSLSMI